MTENRTVVTMLQNLSQKQATEQACLMVIYGSNLGRKYYLTDLPLIIGRANNCAVFLEGESISRQHAQIIKKQGVLYLEDLGSTNGTYVNEKLVSQIQLHHGDVIKIGRVIFKLFVGTDIEEKYEEEIYNISIFDGLTNIYSRRFFLETFERELSKSKRLQSNIILSMFSISQLGNIAKQIGTIGTDTIIKMVAERVKKKIRREDVFARLFNNEFVILISDLPGTNAKVFQKKIFSLLTAEPYEFASKLHTLQFLFAATMFRADHHDTERYLQALRQSLK